MQKRFLGPFHDQGENGSPGRGTEKDAMRTAIWWKPLLRQPICVDMKTCPICSKPSASATSPFCSDRCRAVDLGRWFNESYATPAVELDDVDADALAELTGEAPLSENE